MLTLGSGESHVCVQLVNSEILRRSVSRPTANKFWVANTFAQVHSIELSQHRLRSPARYFF
jgi:hypothetical protein